MRKSLIIIFSLIVVAALVAVVVKSIHTSNVNKEFTISNTTLDVQKNLTTWQNRGEEVLNPVLIKVEHLDDTDTYVAFFANQNGDLGIATLKEGPNGKLKIVNTRYGSNNEENFARYYGAHTDKGNYGVVIGKNPKNEIHSVRVELQNDPLKFTVEVPGNEYFFVTKKLPKGVSSKEFADVFLLDKDNKELNP